MYKFVKFFKINSSSVNNCIRIIPNMLNSLITSRTLPLFIIITLSILTTGFLRLQLFSGTPEVDGNYYTFASQYFYYALSNGVTLKSMSLNLYSLLTSWVYGFEVNQYIFLRLIDGLVAISASIILFKIILKESNNSLFTIILVTTLLIIINDAEIIYFGFRNSIWAAYLPLFSALLIWQNATKTDNFSFYLIGGLVSLGILLREPFLPLFLLAALAIHISYGWRILVQYLIGSAVLGFSVIGIALMLRGWDLLDFINSYFMRLGGIETIGFKFPVAIIEANWFIFIFAFISIIYLIKLYCTDKKLVNINRFYFWLALALLPLLEYYLKLGLAYHFANSLIGFAGLTAMGWKYFNSQESKKIKKLTVMVFTLSSMLIILPAINQNVIKNNRIFLPSDAIQWVLAPDSFRGEQMIKRSQHLKVAAKVYELTREDSTLAVSGFWQSLYPLTKLLPPNDPVTQSSSFVLSDLRGLYLNLNYDKNKLIEILKEHRPTIIVTSVTSESTWPGESDIEGIIEKTNLYNKVTVVPKNSYLNKDGKELDRAGFMSAIIYRLKDFK